MDFEFVGEVDVLGLKLTRLILPELQNRPTMILEKNRTPEIIIPSIYDPVVNYQSSVDESPLNDDFIDDVDSNFQFEDIFKESEEEQKTAEYINSVWSGLVESEEVGNEGFLGVDYGYVQSPQKTAPVHVNFRKYFVSTKNREIFNGLEKFAKFKKFIKDDLSSMRVFVAERLVEYNLQKVDLSTCYISTSKVKDFHNKFVVPTALVLFKTNSKFNQIITVVGSNEFTEDKDQLVEHVINYVKKGKGSKEIRTFSNGMGKMFGQKGFKKNRFRNNGLIIDHQNGYRYKLIL